jgi:hypothetical protein
MPTQTRTKAKILTKEEQYEPTVPVVRASSIGSDCIRKIWYETVSDYEPEFSEDTLRIFEVGDVMEPVIVEWLRRDGYEVEYNPGSQEAGTEIVIPVNGGEIRGHHDAIIKPSMDIAVDTMIDIKTMNDFAWKKWKSTGTMKNKFGYACQATIYAGAFGLTQCGVVGMNKNNSKLHMDTFPFDPMLYETLISKAEYILSFTEPPTPGDFLFSANDMIPNQGEFEPWVCKYCWVRDMGLCDGQ